MSALGQKQTSVASLDHLVGGSEQSWCHRETERSRCLEINDQLELARLLDRKVGGLLALEDAIDIGCGAAEQVGAVNTVSDQASAPGELGANAPIAMTGYSTSTVPALSNFKVALTVLPCSSGCLSCRNMT